MNNKREDIIHNINNNQVDMLFMYNYYTKHNNSLKLDFNTFKNLFSVYMRNQKVENLYSNICVDYSINLLFHNNKFIKAL